MFMFVVDTEQYAGNFSRQLTAYMTGRVGECGVGQEEADTFHGDCEGCDGPFDDVVVLEMDDDDGYRRSCTVWPTRRWFNNGWGGCYPDDGQHDEQAQVDKRRACLARAKKFGTDKSLADEPLHKFPAYLSVAIFLARKPTDEEIHLLKERAFRFRYTNRSRNTIKITGFRLLERVSTEREVWSTHNDT